MIDPRRTETAELADIHLRGAAGHRRLPAWPPCWACSCRRASIDRASCGAHAVDARPGARRARRRPHRRLLRARRPRPGPRPPRGAARSAGRARSRRFEDLGRADEPRLDAGELPALPAHRAHGEPRQAGGALHPHALTAIAAAARRAPHRRSSGRASSGASCPATSSPTRSSPTTRSGTAAMLVEAANPAHSLADSQRFREALGALDTLVVIDVAMSETARLAALRPAGVHASSRRRRRRSSTSTSRATLPPPPAPARSAAGAAARGRDPCPPGRGAGRRDRSRFAPLREAAARGRDGVRAGLRGACTRRCSARRPGRRCCSTARCSFLPEPLREGAVCWGSRCGARWRAPLARARRLRRLAARGWPRPVRRHPRLPSGVVFAARRVARGPRARRDASDSKLHLSLPDLAGRARRAGRGARSARPRPELTPSCSPPASAARSPPTPSSATRPGGRRIPPARCASAPKTPRAGRRHRRRRAAHDPARIGGGARRGVRRHAARAPRAAQRARPLVPERRGRGVTGVAPNELTAAEDRDPFVGTPWHKPVPARVERVPA